jgi:hypothetical protein
MMARKGTKIGPDDRCREFLRMLLLATADAKGKGEKKTIRKRIGAFHIFVSSDPKNKDSGWRRPPSYDIFHGFLLQTPNNIFPG